MKAAKADVSAAWADYVAAAGGLDKLARGPSMAAASEASLKRTFKANVEHAVDANEGPDGAVRALGITPFTHMTQKQFEEYFNLQPFPASGACVVEAPGCIHPRLDMRATV